LRVGDRKVRFQNRQDAVDAEFLDIAEDGWLDAALERFTESDS